MPGYAKIWTDIFNDSWFVSLNMTERGFWLQLIVLAKQMGDTGTIFTRSLTKLALDMGTSRSTIDRTLTKMCPKWNEKSEKTNNPHQNALQVNRLDNGTLSILITNYEYWQRLRTAHPAQNKPQSGQQANQTYQSKPNQGENEISAAPDGAEISPAGNQTLVCPTCENPLVSHPSEIYRNQGLFYCNKCNEATTAREQPLSDAELTKILTVQKEEHRQQTLSPADSQFSKLKVPALPVVSEEENQRIRAAAKKPIEK